MRAKIAICSAMKNEEEYLLEWLCFHRLVGVGKFVIYNNQSTDDTPEIVRMFNHRFPGAVQLIDWPRQPGQWLAFKDMIANRKHVAEWVAFLDADEFLFGTEEDDLRKILPLYQDCSAVGVHWLNFGSSGHETTPLGLCIEAFTQRSSDDFRAHNHIKSIVRIDEIDGFQTVHYFNGLRGTVDVAGTLIPPETRGKCSSSRHDVMRINHYVTKSEEQLRIKIARGQPRLDDAPDKFRDIDKYRRNARNDVEDIAIARFIPRVKSMMNEVLAASSSI